MRGPVKLLSSILLAAFAISLPMSAASAARAQEWTLQLELQGRRIEGAPLSWSQDRVFLLGRDGFLWSFAPGEAQHYRKKADGFHSHSQSTMRGRLLREFGPAFDVSGTGRYLVVHPAGERDRWASRFEELYRSFVHYFAARGFQPQPPQFPLVAVVFSQREEFVRYAAREGADLRPGVLGYYSPISNRILLYALAGTHEGGEDDWRLQSETIIHEAAHQAAFNTGVHSRFAMPPYWVAEGLGTMFEARGVWDSHRYPRQSDRINPSRLQAFQRRAATRRPGTLAELVASDRLFHTDPDGAYAEAWALTFYLAETEPRKYIQYLTKTASRPHFTAYRAPERLRDFTESFGGDLDMLEARLLRFMAGLAPN